MSSMRRSCFRSKGHRNILIQLARNLEAEAWGKNKSHPQASRELTSITARETSGAGREPRCLFIPSNSTDVQASGQTVGYRDHDDVLVCLRSYTREFLPIADSSSSPASQINEEQQVMFGYRLSPPAEHSEHSPRGQLPGKHVRSTARGAQTPCHNYFICS